MICPNSHKYLTGSKLNVHCLLRKKGCRDKKKKERRLEGRGEINKEKQKIGGEESMLGKQGSYKRRKVHDIIIMIAF